MKPHLPVRLFRAVALVLAVAPATLYADYSAPTEIVVPDSYTNSVELNGAVDFATQTEATAYRLTGDVTMSPAGASFGSGASYLYTSDSADELSSISFTNPTGSTNQAFSVSTEVNFDSLKDVSFSSFSSPWQHGGAIYVGASGDLNFSNNYSVKFNSNSLKTNAFASNGGAIDVEGASSFTNNHEVIFDNNSTLSNGGAVCIYKFGDANPNASFSGNDIVKFTGNYTRNQSGGLGGAISMSGGQLELTDNTELTFDANKAQSTYLSQGGAIRASDGKNTIDISHNGAVSFTNNQSVCSGTSANGGAITAIDTELTINNNDSLIFSGNKVQVSTGTITKSEGGALFVGGNSSLQMQNNASVIFEDNKAQVGNTVKYNGLHAADSVVDYNPNNPSQYRTYIYELDVEISAPEEGSIEFRDCAFIDVSKNAASSFQLNSTYTGEDGKEIAQTGEIIFTGKYMTSGDKTSEFKGTASLHDGKLTVKEGAVLKADTLVVTESVSGKSIPTLEVNNATLTANKITLEADTKLTNTNGTISGVDDNSLLEIVGGKVENSGGISMNIAMEFGELTASEGSTFASIMATEGIININGIVTIKGELTLGNATMTSLYTTTGTEGLVIVNLPNATSGINIVDVSQLTVGDNVVFNVSVDSFDDLNTNNVLTIFSNANDEQIDITQTITVTDKSNNIMEVTYTDNGDGSVTLTVPEPTTATLSLLALAALAARRRRK